MNGSGLLPFIKMNGAGNDFVIFDGLVNAVPDDLSELAKRVCNRRTGIGADGVISLRPATDGDVEMQIWNADGSIDLMCGNGARCVALWMRLQGRLSKHCRIKTATRSVNATIVEFDDRHSAARVIVDMGTPSFDPNSVLSRLDLNPSDLAGHDVRALEYAFVSMGNPHAVVFDHELTDRNVLRLSEAMQQHSAFPDGINVEWVNVTSPRSMAVRVVERGVGETPACGSGACAAVVAATLRGFCESGREIDVQLPGGLLTVRWEPDQNVHLTGPAAVNFTGELPV